MRPTIPFVESASSPVPGCVEGASNTDYITTRGYGMDLFHVAVVVDFLSSSGVNLPANQRQLMFNVGVF